MPKSLVLEYPTYAELLFELRLPLDLLGSEHSQDHLRSTWHRPLLRCFPSRQCPSLCRRSRQQPCRSCAAKSPTPSSQSTRGSSLHLYQTVGPTECRLVRS